MNRLSYCLPLNGRTHKQKPRSNTAGLCAARIEELPDYTRGSISPGPKGFSVEIRGSAIVDDIQITSNTYEVCLLNTVTVLSHLAKRARKVSLHKAQTCSSEKAAGGLPPLGALIPCLDLSKVQPHYTGRDEGQAANEDSLKLIPIHMADLTLGAIVLPEALVIPSTNTYIKGPVMEGMR